MGRRIAEGDVELSVRGTQSAPKRPLARLWNTGSKLQISSSAQSAHKQDVGGSVASVLSASMWP